MAHKRLKGIRQPKLSKIKRKKGKNEKKREAEKEAKSSRKAYTPRTEEKSGKQMNKKEAKRQAALDKMHHDLYAGGERILLVGEGNFSFALALCRQLGSGAGVYASSLDTEAELKQKYADSAACRKEIEESLGGTCLTGVDATRLHKVKEFKGAFRKIVFNFPHLGGGEKDVDKSVTQHRQLLAAFFDSAVKCLDPEHDSSIHVALKVGEPYKSWKVVQTCRAACPELDLSTVVPFMAEAWKGYEHRRTLGFSDRFSRQASEELAKGAKVYVFRKGATGCMAKGIKKGLRERTAGERSYA